MYVHSFIIEKRDESRNLVCPVRNFGEWEGRASDP